MVGRDQVGEVVYLYDGKRMLQGRLVEGAPDGRSKYLVIALIPPREGQVYSSHSMADQDPLTIYQNPEKDWYPTKKEALQPHIDAELRRHNERMGDLETILT